ncbi:uncharacterized protein LOC115885164 [Sitophilus oryzae]|uniref:Uncharacterized protein LOC115885164 n=1 Tax=Sitophilus oryzae TaxID=7048 RepID=A0A6J2Y9G4_SITOR|nr:uncharacterized protein LOC115885164 [Sitophilus oryzae]
MKATTKTTECYFKFLLVFYTLCLQILSINSRTSTLWKLNSDRTKIIEGDPNEDSGPSSQYITGPDPVFNIITSTAHYGSLWVKENRDNFCSNCPNEMFPIFNKNRKNDKNVKKFEVSEKNMNENDLSCGRPVNFTFYDSLVGVINRHKHPPLVEPEAVVDFVKKFKFKPGKTFDLELLAEKLKEIKKEKPKLVSTFQQLGNYWRIKGEPKEAIECFRKALAISPHNSDVLLNLAKVLFHLQYLDDAIYLTRRSLEVAPPEKGAWQQYFTLGEIFKAYGHYQEAEIHFKHTLDLNPGFEPAIRVLKEMEELPSTPMHFYTVIIIICLVVAVLVAILTSMENSAQIETNQSQKHYGRSSNMKSLHSLSWTNKKSRKTTT